MATLAQQAPAGKRRVRAGLDTMQRVAVGWRRLAFDCRRHGWPPVQDAHEGDAGRLPELVNHFAGLLCLQAQRTIDLGESQQPALRRMQETLPAKFPFMLNVVLHLRLRLDCVAVAPSERGLGVFALRRIPAGRVATVFPVDLLMLLADDSVGSFAALQQNETCVVHKAFMRSDPPAEWSLEDSRQADAHAQSWRAHCVEVGSALLFGDPRAHSPDACAHMVGMGVVPNSELVTIARGVLVVLRTVMDVEAGAELLIPNTAL
mgnify:CR=1 FL=1